MDGYRDCCRSIEPRSDLFYSEGTAAMVHARAAPELAHPIQTGADSPALRGTLLYGVEG